MDGKKIVQSQNTRYLKLSLKKNKLLNDAQHGKLNRSPDIVILDESLDRLEIVTPKTPTTQPKIYSPIVVNDSSILSEDDIPLISVSDKEPSKKGNSSFNCSRNCLSPESQSRPSTGGWSPAQQIITANPKNDRIPSTPKDKANESNEQCTIKTIERSQKKILSDLYGNAWRSIPHLFKTISKRYENFDGVTKKLFADEDERVYNKRLVREERELYIKQKKDIEDCDTGQKKTFSDVKRNESNIGGTEKKSKKKLFTEKVPCTPDLPKNKIKRDVNSTTKKVKLIKKGMSVTELVEIMKKNEQDTDTTSNVLVTKVVNDDKILTKSVTNKSINQTNKGTNISSRENKENKNPKKTNDSSHQSNNLTNKSNDLTNKSHETNKSNDLTKKCKDLTNKSNDLTNKSNDLRKKSKELTNKSNDLTKKSKELTSNGSKVTNKESCLTDKCNNLPDKAVDSGNIIKHVELLTKNIDNVCLTPENSKRLSFVGSLAEVVPTWRCHPEAFQFRDNYKNLKEKLARRLYIEFNKEVFGDGMPEDMALLWDPKFRRTAGTTTNRLIKNANGDRIRTSIIKLSTKVVDTPARLRDTLIHEMCHAATWLIDAELRAGHGPLWKRWAKRALRVYPELGEISRCHDMDIHFKYSFKCTTCGYSIDRHSKSIDISKKCCGYCRGRFEIVVNKKNKDGVVVKTPARKATNGFALYVKENYANVKDASKTHAQVMKILGENYSALKSKSDVLD